MHFTERNALCRAAEQGDQDTVRERLASGAAGPNTRDAVHGRTLLSWAVEQGQQDVVEMLLRDFHADANDAIVDEHSFGGNGRPQTPPLILAARNGHAAIVTLLLDHGAMIDSVDDEQGRTALSYAVGWGQTDIAELLLARGADTGAGAADENGRNVPSYAAGRGRTGTVELLLARGANIGAVDEYGRDALSYAAENGHAETARALLDHRVAPNSTDGEGRSPLSYAASSGDVELVQMLLTAQQPDARSVESADDESRSALSYAASEGSVNTIKLLLQSGAAAESIDNKGRSPLSYAAEGGHTDAVRVLLENGASAHSMDEDCRTPLSYAAEGDDVELVRLLLDSVAAAADAGAELETDWTDQGSTLINAIEDEDVLRLLLDRGANPFSAGVYGTGDHTPLAFAAERGLEGALRMLLAFEGTAENRDEVERIKREHCSSAVVHLATEDGLAAPMKILLEEGIFPEPKLDTLETAYRLAQIGEDTDVLQLLEKHAEGLEE